MVIAIDFDGTIVRHEFPIVGKPIPHAIRVMKRLQDAGHQLILYTMRSDGKATMADPHGEPKNYLTDAIEYCLSEGIEFWGVNANVSQVAWTTSPKVYAQFYIDDAAIGCPLMNDEDGHMVVDWLVVESMLFDVGDESQTNNPIDPLKSDSDKVTSEPEKVLGIENVGDMVEKCDALIKDDPPPVDPIEHRNLLLRELRVIRENLREYYVYMAGRDPWE